MQRTNRPKSSVQLGGGARAYPRHKSYNRANVLDESRCTAVSHSNFLSAHISICLAIFFRTTQRFRIGRMRQHPCTELDSCSAQTSKTAATIPKSKNPSSLTANTANTRASQYQSPRYQIVSSTGTLTILRNLHPNPNCPLKQANPNQHSRLRNTWLVSSKAHKNWVSRSLDNDRLLRRIQTSVSIGWPEPIWKQPRHKISSPLINLGHSSPSQSCTRVKIISHRSRRQ